MPSYLGLLPLKANVMLPTERDLSLWMLLLSQRACKGDCSIATNVTVPLTRVDFEVWEAMNVSDYVLAVYGMWYWINDVVKAPLRLSLQIEEQAQEVQSGLHMLNEAIGSLQISNQTEVLQSHIDASIRNIASIRQVLRSLSIPVSSGNISTNRPCFHLVF